MNFLEIPPEIRQTIISYLTPAIGEQGVILICDCFERQCKEEDLCSCFTVTEAQLPPRRSNESSSRRRYRVKETRKCTHILTFAPATLATCRTLRQDTFDVLPRSTALIQPVKIRACSADCLDKFLHRCPLYYRKEIRHIDICGRTSDRRIPLYENPSKQEDATFRGSDIGLISLIEVVQKRTLTSFLHSPLQAMVSHIPGTPSVPEGFGGMMFSVTRALSNKPEQEFYIRWIRIMHGNHNGIIPPTHTIGSAPKLSHQTPHVISKINRRFGHILRPLVSSHFASERRLFHLEKIILPYLRLYQWDIASALARRATEQALQREQLKNGFFDRKGEKKCWDETAEEMEGTSLNMLLVLLRAEEGRMVALGA